MVNEAFSINLVLYPAFPGTVYSLKRNSRHTKDTPS